jgi:hypothetical protein
MRRSAAAVAICQALCLAAILTALARRQRLQAVSEFDVRTAYETYTDFVHWPLGDSCGSLASKCGISAADFMKVNTKTDLCSKLGEGQKVCCSNGKYPDLKPKKDSNGNCAIYTTKRDDYCAKIAVARDITVTELESYNKKTWGWNGCNRLFPDFKSKCIYTKCIETNTDFVSTSAVCVSEGNPPMPANVPVRYLFPFPRHIKIRTP